MRNLEVASQYLSDERSSILHSITRLPKLNDDSYDRIFCNLETLATAIRGKLIAYANGEYVPGKYISLDILVQLYNAVAGQLLKNCSLAEWCCMWNLLTPSLSRIEIKHGGKHKLMFLIRSLKERNLNAGSDENKWISTILKNLRIEKAYYDRHAGDIDEIRSRANTDANAKFIATLETIIKVKRSGSI
jgi:hypothetical protein